MQGNKRKLDSLLTDFFEKFRRKMQTCRRSGGRTDFFGIDSLVALVIFQIRLDIVRKRHLPDSVENFIEIPVVSEFCKTVAIIDYINDFRFQFPSAERKACSRFCAAPRPSQDFPCVAFLMIQEKKLYFCSGSFLDSVKPRRQNTRIIQNEAVVRIQAVYNIVKMLVSKFPRLFVQGKQPRRIPRFYRRLRN